MTTRSSSHKCGLTFLLMFILSGVSFAGDREELQKIVASDRSGLARFGTSVCVDGDYAIVGAYRAHYDAPEPRVTMAGAVYAYVRSDTDWIHHQQIFPNIRSEGGGFGYAVSISGDKLVGGCATWRAHVFARSGGIWAEVRQLVAHDSLFTDGFGNAVSISGNFAIVGAPSSWLDPSGGNNMSDAGAAYVFGPSSTGIGDEGSWDMPLSFQLNQNFPNPFNPSTAIGYRLPATGYVTVKVFDELGREVATLVNSIQGAGAHTIRWNASGFASGVYIYEINAGNFRDVKKMVLMK